MAKLAAPIAVACVVALACGPAARRPAPPPTTSAPASRGPAPCEVAGELRAGLPRLERDGRLDRLTRTARLADALCPVTDAAVAAVVARGAAELARPGDPVAVLGDAMQSRHAGDAAAARRGMDRALALFEAASRDRIRPVLGDAIGNVRVARASAGGKIALAGKRGARLLDARSGTVTPLEGVTSADDLEFVDERYLVVTTDTEAIVWDVATMRVSRRFAGKPVGFSAERDWFVWQTDHALHAWSPATGASHDFAQRAAVTSVRVAPRGAHVAVAASGGEAWLWDLATDRHLEIRALDVTEPFAWSPDARWLAVRKRPPWPSGVALVDVAAMRVAHDLFGTRCDHKTTALAWRPDARALVVAGGAAEMCLWDLEPPRMREIFDLPEERRPGVPVAPVRLLEFTADGSGLLAGAAVASSPDLADVHLFRMPTAERLSALGLRRRPQTFDGGSLLLAGGERRPVVVTPRLAVVDAALGSDDGPLSADGTRIVRSIDGARTLVDVASGARLATLPGRGGALSFSGTALFEVAAGRLRAWDAASGRLLAASEDPPVAVDAARFADFETLLKHPRVRLERGPDGADELVFVPLKGREEQRLATLFATAGAAVALLADGTFETFGDGARARLLVSCALGERRFPIDLCEERLHVRGALGVSIHAAVVAEREEAIGGRGAQ